jgi:hypothetical protein
LWKLRPCFILFYFEGSEQHFEATSAKTLRTLSDADRCVRVSVLAARAFEDANFGEERNETQHALGLTP